MAYENTHIYLADRIIGKIDDDGLKGCISDHKDCYFPGSIFPDILFYSKDKQAIRTAHNIHGEDGLPTDWIIFKCSASIELSLPMH